MTYEESSALMQDGAFHGRVKVAALKYADSILIEATGTPAHNTRVRWAVGCFRGPEATASELQSPTVMDPAVQSAGAAIEDAGLQAAVEGVVNKLL